MKKPILLQTLLVCSLTAHCWGFFGHQRINYYAVFLLPPEMMVLYKPNLAFLSEHAVDPDKRRYLVAAEGPRHYIDMDRYGKYPYPDLPRNWDSAVARFSEDTLMQNGIVPWHVQVMTRRLTYAFREKNFPLIMKYSAEIGHYISDAHVPLHANSNHNGQYTGQHGIHGFWESRIPELLAGKEFDFIIGKAAYIENPGKFIWARVLESALAADSVLALERKLTAATGDHRKYAFEERNGTVVRQYSAEFTRKYDRMLDGMVERRMRQAIFAVASFWFTAWVNAGQPDLKPLAGKSLSDLEKAEFDTLNSMWKTGSPMIGRQE